MADALAPKTWGKGAIRDFLRGRTDTSSLLGTMAGSWSRPKTPGCCSSSESSSDNSLSDFEASSGSSKLKGVPDTLPFGWASSASRDLPIAAATVTIAQYSEKHSNLTRRKLTSDRSPHCQTHGKGESLSAWCNICTLAYEENFRKYGLYPPIEDVVALDNPPKDPDNSLIGKEKTKGKRLTVEQEKRNSTKEASLAKIAQKESRRDHTLWLHFIFGGTVGRLQSKVALTGTASDVTQVPLPPPPSGPPPSNQPIIRDSLPRTTLPPPPKTLGKGSQKHSQAAINIVGKPAPARGLDDDSPDYLTASFLRDGAFGKGSGTTFKKKLECKDAKLATKDVHLAELDKVKVDLELAEKELRELKDQYNGMGQLLGTPTKEVTELTSKNVKLKRELEATRKTCHDRQASQVGEAGQHSMETHVSQYLAEIHDSQVFVRRTNSIFSLYRSSLYAPLLVIFVTWYGPSQLGPNTPTADSFAFRNALCSTKSPTKNFLSLTWVLKYLATFCSQGNLNVQEVQSLMLSQENRLHYWHTPGVIKVPPFANHAQISHRGRDSNSNQSRGGHRGRGRAHRSLKGIRSKIVCQICTKHGHSAINCCYRHEEDSPPYSQTSNGDNTNTKNSFLATPKTVVDPACPEHKGYYCLHPSVHTYVTRNCLFDEEEFSYSTLFPESPNSTLDYFEYSTDLGFAPCFPMNALRLPMSPLQQLFLPHNKLLQQLIHKMHQQFSFSNNNDVQNAPTIQLQQQQCNNNSTTIQHLYLLQPAPVNAFVPALVAASGVLLVPINSVAPSHYQSVAGSTHGMQTRVKSGVIKPQVLAATKHPFIVNKGKCEPTTITQALLDPKWNSAMNKEFRALVQNHTWDLVPPDPLYNVVGNKWVFKEKFNADGTVQRQKARLVAK
uniref:Uncharacterized protein n=1 Tax=Cannabis sativa TaxID=3483 RepID=A0A803PYW8_CANSA